MPPKYKSRKRVASDDEDGSGNDAAPTTKRTKSEFKSAGSTEVQTDKEGCEFFQLSNTRRVQVANFKGVYQIALREYYEKDGQMLPGKKGINLTLEQFATLVKVLPQLEGILRGKGQDIPRPNYDGAEAKGGSSALQSEGDDASETRDAEDGDASPAGQRSKLVRAKDTKRNHEATSDEDD